ncbi:MAG: hypothetical protein LUD47_03740 [Clostridia bacterium]|nr:hypothetical protein [Clostridia bacterium]
MDILDNLQLLTTVYGRKYIQNVALMVFCEHADRFLPKTWAEIKTFPEGNRRAKKVVVKGSVPAMISGAAGWIRENVIRKKDVETDFQIETTGTVNYPDEAVEEAIANAFYHRDYRSGQPVSIEIEPNRIRVVSFPGIDSVISYKAVEEGVRFVPKYARNKRLGEFLKELNLARGIGVGVPIIQQVLRDNGSPRAVFKTDDDRKAVSVEIPIHPDFLS